jgi:putative transposase
MTTNIFDVQGEQRRAEPDLSVLAEQLVATARTRGVELTGPGGLLTGLTRQVLETALETELGEHLGHERGERSGSGNVRNGWSAKTVRTGVGEVRISVPRDRAHDSRATSRFCAAPTTPPSLRPWCPSTPVG